MSSFINSFLTNFSINNLWQQLIDIVPILLIVIPLVFGIFVFVRLFYDLYRNVG